MPGCCSVRASPPPAPSASRCFNSVALWTSEPLATVDNAKHLLSQICSEVALKSAGRNGDMDYVVLLHAVHKHNFHLRKGLFAFSVLVEFGSSYSLGLYHMRVCVCVCARGNGFVFCL